MRIYKANKQVSVHAIAGTHVVILGINVTDEAKVGLLGFSIARKKSDEALIYLKSPKRFAQGAADELSDASPFQAFLHLDHSVEPSLSYRYFITPQYGRPGNLKAGSELAIDLQTENTDDGSHGVFFNSGVAGSQQYAELFEDYRRSYSIGPNLWKRFIKPEDVPNNQAYTWLSRGLEEGMLGFIQQAKDKRYQLRASVYEFTHEPVIREFVAALARGADVKIVHHRKTKTQYTFKRDYDKEVVLRADANSENDDEPVIYKNKTIVEKHVADEVGAAADKAVRQAGIENPLGLDLDSLEKAFDEMLIKRTHPAISHNKFIILLKDNVPVQVWTGSTNFTAGGIFGQSNVGHVIRDRATAEAYFTYWQQLQLDPVSKELRKWTVEQGLALAGDDVAPPHSITPIFSPRANEDVLDWYASQIGNAEHSVHLTSAFTISDPFLEQLCQKVPPKPDADAYVRYTLLEGITGLLRDKSQAIRKVQLNKVAWGETLKTRNGEEELVESLTGLNDHVNYLHTKYMLIDPLTDDPIVISGSANFSSASTTKNDENMVVIRGNTRIADIFLGEFMRLFNHYAKRNELNTLSDKEFNKAHLLSEDDSWTAPYFDSANALCKERKLFAEPAKPKQVLDLKYYMLDWDDNILFMPTKIHVVIDGKPKDVSTKEFAQLHETGGYSFPEGGAEAAFAEFNDQHGDFVGDVKKALQNQSYAPSFEAFKRALCEARLFAIVTARGHSADTLRKGIEAFIDIALSEDDKAKMICSIQRYNRLAGIHLADEVCIEHYLDLNGFIGISSPAFLSVYANAHPDDASNVANQPQEAKTFAVQKFVERVVGIAKRLPAKQKRIAFGFSDDDKMNLSTMVNFIQQHLEKEFQHVHFFAFDTSGKKAVIERL